MIHRRRRRLSPLFLALATCLIVGCHNVETRSYDVTVKNDATTPVTVWLTKNGLPYENGWKSPEDIAIESPRADEPITGVVVPPGKVASTGQRKGQFAPRVDAILRVYVGQKTFTDLLTIHAGDTDRIDVRLKPGANNLTVTDDGGGGVKVAGGAE